MRRTVVGGVELPRRSTSTALWSLRIGGIVFTVASTAVLFLTLGGHSHGGLIVTPEGAGPEILNPGAIGELSAGSVRLDMQKPDGDEHEFVIRELRSKRLVARSTIGWRAGESVLLAPGEYQVQCVTAGHASKGMEFRLVVK